MITPFPETNDARWTRVAHGLKRLCTRGVEPWWIMERTPTLLELECVRRAAEEQGGPLARARALVALLRDLVSDFQYEPHGVLLSVVLGLEPDYVAHDGTNYHLLELSAAERRALAGREFRGGRNSVGANAIRLHHEPQAIVRLAHLLLRREIELTGFWASSDTPNPDYVPLYFPGETAPTSGAYAASNARGDALGREIVIRQGERFPLALDEESEVGWVSREMLSGHAR